MIPPLSTTPSAPTMTRSTFSNTYLWKKEILNKEVQVVKCGPFCCFIEIFLNKCAYPTAASRTTVTGTFSFFKASAICRLKTWEKKKKKKVWFSERAAFREAARTPFTGSSSSPGWVRLRLGHINGEAFLLCRRLFQHPEDDSGVRVSQDFLRGAQAKGSKRRAKLLCASLKSLKRQWATCMFKLGLLTTVFFKTIQFFFSPLNTQDNIRTNRLDWPQRHNLLWYRGIFKCHIIISKVNFKLIEENWYSQHRLWWTCGTASPLCSWTWKSSPGKVPPSLPSLSCSGTGPNRDKRHGRLRLWKHLMWSQSKKIDLHTTIFKNVSAKVNNILLIALWAKKLESWATNRFPGILQIEKVAV